MQMAAFWYTPWSWWGVHESPVTSHQSPCASTSEIRLRSPMRIGITCYPTYGGSGVVATKLGMEIASPGHDIHFINYPPPTRLKPNNPRPPCHELAVHPRPRVHDPP